MSMREQGERNWNGEITFSKPKDGDLPTGITRSLEDIHRGLAQLGGQGKIEGFFNNVGNADKLSGTVEDIRDAMMEYQVCVRNIPTIGISDTRTRLHYSRISTTRIANSSWVTLHHPVSLLTNKYAGIDRSGPPQWDAPFRRRWLYVWEQARLLEGNEEGCPAGPRPLDNG